MKERGILYSAPMVRAILEDRKTLTRRPVKPQPYQRDPSPGFENWNYVKSKKRGLYSWRERDFPAALLSFCPYGVPGDRLWVKETFGFVEHIDYGRPDQHDFVHILGPHEQAVIYREEAIKAGFEWCGESKSDRWRPSIHMPRWASRITTEIVNVRVERLQDITEEDAIAEGIQKFTKDGKVFKYWAVDPSKHKIPGLEMTWQEMPRTAREAYARLWDATYGPGAWDANPWVWVITSKRVVVDAVQGVPGDGSPRHLRGSGVPLRDAVPGICASGVSA